MPKKTRAPYLGKVALFWCDSCNVPLLKNQKCNVCQNSAKKVSVSPPGDVRPAFAADYQLLRKVVNKYYGLNLGTILFSEKNVILLNRIGGLDRAEEVIMNGNVIGQLIFNPLTKEFSFNPRTSGGYWLIQIFRALKVPEDKYPKTIWLNKDGSTFFSLGKSILVPGVSHFAMDIQDNDYILVMDAVDHKFLGIAVSKATSKDMQQMLTNNHGNLAKNRFYIKDFTKLTAFSKMKINIEFSSEMDQSGNQNFDFLHRHILEGLKNVYQANYSAIQQEIQYAERFIRTTISKTQHPVAVAYSGGKDSLGVLLLVYRVIGANFKIFFADTGLELPEVLQNVHDVAQALNMNDRLIIRQAKETFWNLLEDFGPPGRDYRFCCHSLKAQQIMTLIKELYNGEKVLSFLGQRQYESLTRAQSAKVYVNSFIPLQIAATPIKSWISLLLWLFILFEPVQNAEGNRVHVPVTPLYFKGHERLGCYLCPASSLATLDLLKTTHPSLHSRWFDFLDSYAQKYHLPKEWVELGLWRYKRLPTQWKNLIEDQNIHYSFQNTTPNEGLDLKITKGFSPCLQTGYSVKGRFTQVLDLSHIVDFLPALTTNFEYDDELDVISARGTYKRETYRFNLFSDGSIFLLAQSKTFDYEGWFQHFYTTVYRALYCNQCKTCVSVCPQQAIGLKESQIEIMASKCTSCKLCSSHCPLFQISKTIIARSFPQ